MGGHARRRRAGRAGPRLADAHWAHPPTGRTLRHPAAAGYRRSRDARRPRGRTPQEDGGGMEVKPGYKQTEVGVIPEEWEVAPLSRVIERLEAGVSVNSVDEELRSYPHDQSILKTSAISGGQFLPFECKKVAPRDLSRARLNPRADTIIISRMNTPDLVGECGYVEADYPNLFLPDRLWMTRNHAGSDVCVRWLNYLLSSKPYKNRIKGLATGTSGSMK